MFICRSFPKVRVGACDLSLDIPTLGYSRWLVCRFDPITAPSGHSRSYEVTFVLLPLTLDRIEIERWRWSQCVSLAQTHRLICKMTYLAQYVTSLDVDMRSDSDIDLLMLRCGYFDASWRQEQDAAKLMSLAFLVQKLFAKTYFCKKALSWPFLTSVCSLTRWS